MGTRRRFSKEFKIKVLQELETKSMAEVCRLHDLSCSTVCTWRKDYESDPQGAFLGKGRVRKEEAKSAQYLRLIGQLYSEIDLLRTAYDSLKQQQVSERKKKMV